MRKSTSFYVFLFFIATFGWAQDLNRSVIFREGDKLFKSAQYIKAMRYYKEVLDREENHMGALYQMGECNRLLFDYESALYYYEKVFKSDGGLIFPLSGFYYAEMLKHGGQYAEALEIFDQFHEKLKSQGKHEDPSLRIFYKQAHIEKEGCLLALNENTNSKPDHHFQLADGINSESMDYAAIGYGGNKVVFTSSKAGTKGSLMDYRFGESTADLYRYEFVDGEWKELKDSDKFNKAINTKWGDGAGSFNKAVTKFYYTNCNDDLGEVCHIFVSSLVGGNWSEPKALGSAINQQSFDSRHPDISPTGDTLFFSSNRPGGHGNYDIWMSISAGGENWSQPINLGDQVNTPFFEVSPIYDASQKVLFFASDGHRGFGGFDVFMAKGASFLNPEIYNPGSPFNSNKDEIFMYVDKNKGFISSNREGGKGKLDIYEFEIREEKEIITEIGTDDAIAGRNSLFSDDYDFDSDQQEAINDIISSFLAAKIVDVELALSDELAKIYNELSLDDKERINRIIYARIRQLNEKGIQALRVEDEFYYQDMNSSDKNHMDNLITRYIGESEVGRSVKLGQQEQQFYASLDGDEKESTDRLIATRVKQANAFEYKPVTYQQLEAGDKRQVDDIASKYIEEKTKIDNLTTMSPTQTYYLRQLDDDKKAQVMTSIKEKLLDLTNDTRYQLTKEDRDFYEKLSADNPEQIEELKDIATSLISSEVETIDLTAEDKRIYRFYNATQQKSLNRILAKIINNTVKSDLYFAEANLTKEEKEQVPYLSPDQFDAFVQNKSSINEVEDKERIKRFLTVSAKTYDPSNPVFMDMVDKLPERTPALVNEAYIGSGDNLAASSASASSVSSILGTAASTSSLSSKDLRFYNNLPAEQKETVQRIMAMEKVTRAYQNPQIKQADDTFLEKLTPRELQYMQALTSRLAGRELSTQERALINAALSYYEQDVSAADKGAWDRLIARGAMEESDDGYRFPATEIAFMNALSEEEASNLSNMVAHGSTNTGASTDERSIASSLFSDSYDFDSDDLESIYDVISAFVAAKIVDVDLVLTGELATFYNNLSDADKARIENIVYARIRQMNERGLQAMRVEDEFYYNDLTSSDQNHMDDLITRFIDDSGVAETIGLDAESSAYYTALNDADKERVDRLIATRVKEANNYRHTPTDYDQLPPADKREVERLTSKFIANKSNLNNLEVTADQRSYLEGLNEQKRSQVVSAIQDKLLLAYEDPQFQLTGADKRLYQQLGAEEVASMKELAHKMIQFDADEIELTPQDLQVYERFNESEQENLDKILVKIIGNTVKSDIYFAETNLTYAEKTAVATMSPAEQEVFIAQISSRFPDPEDLDRIKRFIQVSASNYNSSEGVFRKNAQDETAFVSSGNTDNAGLPNPSIPDLNVATLESASLLEARDLAFYSGLPPANKSKVDRIIAMRYVNDSYQDPQVKQQDDTYFENLTSNEKQYIRRLSQTLQGDNPLSTEERLELNEALRYYQDQGMVDQNRWDRLIARQVMTESNGRFILPSSDMAFLNSLSATQKESLSHLVAYRRASQSIISGDFNEDIAEIQLLVAGSTDVSMPSPALADQFYNQLSPKKKTNVDLIIAMNYLNAAYQNPRIKQEDEDYFDRLTPEAKEHLLTMSAHLKSDRTNIDPAEQTRLNDALTYYVSLSPRLMSRWDRLVAREALSKNGNQYSLPAESTDIRKELTSNELENLESLTAFRSSNQMVISSPFDSDLRKIGVSSQALAARSGNESSYSDNVQNIRPVIEDEQKIETLSAIDLDFYNDLPKSEQKSIDRIIAMEYINNAYGNPNLRRSDELFFNNLTPAEKTYIRLMALDLKADRELSRAEQSMINEAFAFYSSLSPSLKSRWNRLVAGEALVSDGNRFKLSPADAAFRQRLSPSAQASLSSIRNFRYSNQRILSENLEKESKDIARSNINFGVAKFNNSNFNYISVGGTLIKNDDGTPLKEFPLLIVDSNGRTIAKTSTGQDGRFDFEDIPKGNYQVVSGREVDAPGLASPFFVKDLRVDGSSEGRFNYTTSTNIYFDFDSDRIRPEAEIALREIAQYYKKHDVYIELKSHTDDIGADNYNLNLSEKRNDAALNELRDLGVKSDDIEWLAMGNKSPVAPNNTAYGRQFNRRIEISLKSNQPISYRPADVYLVRPNGTLFSIAKNFQLDVETLKKANGLQGNTLKAYSPLRVPNPRNFKPNLNMLVELDESVAISKNTYIVKQGESIMSIASKFNIPEELIIEMNDLKQTALSPGQQLRIYRRDN